MFARGLKTNIAIHLAVLLLMAMLLINFVMITATRKDLLSSETSKGALLISLIDAWRILSEDRNHVPGSPQSDTAFERTLYKAGVTCLQVLDRNERPVYEGGDDCELKDELSRLTRRAIRTGKPAKEFLGETWGVFLKQRQYMILSVPLSRGGDGIAGTGLVMKLDGTYRKLRRSQQVLLIYIFANTIILTLFGLSALSKFIVKPLNRLVHRADEYREDDEMFFLYEKDRGEFSKLSGALNRMLKRIAEDKEKLHSTVQSLELANVELEHAQKDIIRAEKMASVGRLSSGIAHEIGNPIGIVLGYLELLKQKDIPEGERNEFISRAENEINRINTIIRQLLDFSKSSETGLEPVSVHGIIEEIVNVFKVQPVMKTIELKTFLSADNDMVLADSGQLRQVFLNLLINAADAISSGENRTDGRIDVTSRIQTEIQTAAGSPRTLFVATIIDNGPGISQEHIDNIFDPFYTTKAPGKGTGLGLWVSLFVVEGLGGTIDAASEETGGTRITLCLPSYPGESAA
jgi:signal transduction histidine kinase